jgi:hypothetical protein
MQPTSTIQYSQAARALAVVARERRLLAPSFRCPPRVHGVDRTIRRGRSHCIVSVRLRGRPWVAVAADMVEGVIVANQLVGADAVRVRGALWAALGFESALSSAYSGRAAA